MSRVIMFPAAFLLLLIFGGIAVWGVALFVRKAGLRGVMWTGLSLLLVLAVVGMLAAVGYQRTSHMEAAQVVRMKQIQQDQVARTDAIRRQQARQQLQALPADPLLGGTEERIGSTVAPRSAHQVPKPADTTIILPENHQVVGVPNHEVATVREPKMEIAVLGLGAILFMLGLAVLIGVSVYLAAQGGTLQWRAVAAKLISVMWLIPAVAVVAVPLWIAGERLTPQPVRTPTAPFPRDAPSEIPATLASMTAQSAGDVHEKEVPEWVHHPTTVVGDTRIVVLSSGRRAAVDPSEKDDAVNATRRQVYTQTVSLIRSYFNEAYPISGNLPVPDPVVRSAYGKTFTEKQKSDSGPIVYRYHAQVRLSPEIVDRLLPAWKSQQTQHRLYVFCTALGVLTLVLGTTTAYLRLDRMTDGAYRGRLKLASLSFITAGSLIAGIFLS